jgi:hypothetical protein
MLDFNYKMSVIDIEPCPYVLYVIGFYVECVILGSVNEGK